MLSKLKTAFQQFFDTQPVKVNGQLAAWKKVNQLKPGMKIAVASDINARGGKVKFEEIVSIEPVGREHVYDIEVEGSHNFIGNGILAHNTYISGNLGIGTTSPGARLQIDTGATATKGLILKAYSTIGSATFTGTGADDCTSGGTFTGTAITNYKVEIDAGDATSPNTFKWSDDAGSTWDVSGVAITGATQTLNNGVTITFGATTGHVTGDFWLSTATPQSADLAQWQNPAGTVLGVIDADGNFGIGTTAPLHKLEVNGDVWIKDPGDYGLAVGNAGNGVIRIGDDSTGASGIYDNSGDLTLDSDTGTLYTPDVTLKIGGATSILNFSSTTGTKQIQTGGTTHLALMPGGNVGVGTATPGSYKLNVNGNTNVTGTLTATTSVSTPLLSLSGTGTINGLDDMDATTETTLESYIDIAGDVAGTGLGSVQIQTGVVDSNELASTAVAAGSYGSVTQVGTFTVDADGRLTAAGNTTITGVSPVGAALTSGYIWLGSASNVAAAVDVSGDVDISNIGVTTIQANAVALGTDTTGNYATGSSEGGAALNLYREDNRTISPSELAAGQLKFGFTSYNNNNTSPWADFLHLRSYSDSSGGSDNLIVFNKSGFGMRMYRQTWGSATAYSSYKDIVLADNSPSTNYLTKYSGTGNSVSIKNSVVYDDGTNIGIGTTVPGAKLHIEDGHIYVNGGYGMTFGNWGSNTPAVPEAQLSLEGVHNAGYNLGTKLLITGYDNETTTYPIYLKDENEQVDFWIKSNPTTVTSPIMFFKGNVGIGTTAPGSYKLNIKSGNVMVDNGTTSRVYFENSTSNYVGIDGNSSQMILNSAGDVRTYAGGNHWVRAKGSIYMDLDDDSNATTDFFQVRNGANGVIMIMEEGTGDIGINMTNPSVELDVTGDIEYTGTITDVSDIRLKENFTSLSNSLDKLSTLSGFSYNLISNPDKREIGLSAQDVQLVFPEAVSIIDEQGHLGLSYPQLIPPIVEAIKELNQKIVNLSQQITTNLVQTQELIADSITIQGQALSDYIASVVEEITPSRTIPLQLEPDTIDPNTGEIQYATLEITTDTNEVVAQFNSQGDLSLLGQLSAESASISGELSAASISAQTASITGQLTARSARLEQLESRMAEFEHIKAQTAELVDATISGTLYATKIEGLDDQLAETLNASSFLDKLLGKKSEATQSASLASLFTLVEDAGYATNSATPTEPPIYTGPTSDVSLVASAVFINNYFSVNGSGYVAQQLGVGEQLLIGNSLAIGHNYIEHQPIDPETPQTLHLQPSGKGTLSLMAGLMTLNEDGQVLIDGDIAISGNLEIGNTLLTNLIEPTVFGDSLQIKLATSSGEVAGVATASSRLEILNQLNTPTATISAQGRGSFAGGINIGTDDLTPISTMSATVASQQPSGKATIRQNTLGITIKSALITRDSLIYISPIGSTGNQILYVKSQTPENLATLEQEGGFSVGFDAPISNNATFNWWIVN